MLHTVCLHKQNCFIFSVSPLKWYKISVNILPCTTFTNWLFKHWHVLEISQTWFVLFISSCRRDWAFPCNVFHVIQFMIYLNVFSYWLRNSGVSEVWPDDLSELQTCSNKWLDMYEENPIELTTNCFFWEEKKKKSYYLISCMGINLQPIRLLNL